MGTLEKAGICVVGALILIIVVVGLINRDGENEDGGPGLNKNDVASKKADSAKRERLNRGRIDFDALKKKAGEAAGDAAAKKDDRDRDRDSGRRNPRHVPSRGGESAERRGEPIDPAHAPGEKPDPRRDSKPLRAGGWPKKHVIKKDELLGHISADYYDTTRMVSRILAANPGLDPRRMKPGTEIVLPAPPAEGLARGGGGKGERPAAARGRTHARRPSFISAAYVRANAGGAAKGGGRKAGGGRTYTVKRGDDLSTIAKEQLGSVRHLAKLLESNKDLIKDPNRLRAGWVLKLPNVN